VGSRCGTPGSWRKVSSLVPFRRKVDAPVGRRAHCNRSPWDSEPTPVWPRCRRFLSTLPPPSTRSDVVALDDSARDETVPFCPDHGMSLFSCGNRPRRRRWRAGGHSVGRRAYDARRRCRRARSGRGQSFVDVAVGADGSSTRNHRQRTPSSAGGHTEHGHEDQQGDQNQLGHSVDGESCSR
jgi:hypothetical protein